MQSQSAKSLEFGSFSAEETKLFQRQSPRETRLAEKNELQFGSIVFGTIAVAGSSDENGTELFQRESLGDAARPLGTNELQFGSLDSAIVSALGGFNVLKKTDLAIKGSVGQLPSKLVPKEENLKSGKATVNNNIQEIPGKSESNGSVKNYERKKGKVGVDVETLSISGNKIGAQKQPAKSNFSAIEKSALNGILVDSLLSMPSSDEFRKTSNEQAPVVKNLLPRGLINSGNLCFLNATLQAFLACSPFVELLQELRTRNKTKDVYPTLCAFVEFISNFDMPTGLSLKKNETGVLETGEPFSPVMFDPVLKSFTPDLLSTSLSGRARQEDAQEFLSFAMDQMHDELLKLEGQFPGTTGNLKTILNVEDDDWETVGPKNKTAVTRTQSFIPSKLSDIFGGRLKSVVKATGNKASATVQPYLLLHLDILLEAVHNIEDALRFFSAPETLEGYRTSAGKAGVVSASKSVKIQTLSKVMIFHLMRFGYGNKGSTKLHKPVRFPLELVLGRELLVSPSAEGRRYELVATITHHGRVPSKGHYTADTRYWDGRWLRYDDASITVVSTNKVLHDQAYMLFYRRL